MSLDHDKHRRTPPSARATSCTDFRAKPKDVALKQGDSDGKETGEANGHNHHSAENRQIQDSTDLGSSCHPDITALFTYNTSYAGQFGLMG